MPERIAALIRSRFPPLPVPNYPPMMGMDPLGVDEYAGFANVAWPNVPPKLYGNAGYDISPAIGFSLSMPPHMWNYHLPGFMLASLLHESEYEPTDSFMWRMRSVVPQIRTGPDTSLAWWAGDDFNTNYSLEQCEAVVQYLEFLREFGADPPYYYDWEVEDDLTLRRWTGTAAG